MFTADEKKAGRYADMLLHYAFIYLAAALFCALFGAVYEHFSHEVYSYYMIYAFAIPLGLGTFPLFGLALLTKNRYHRPRRTVPSAAVSAGEQDREENLPAGTAEISFMEGAADRREEGTEKKMACLPGRLSMNAWNSGVAALTVGCIFQGVLEIYGTTNRLIVVYPAAAAVLLCAGLISFLVPFTAAGRMQRA